MSNITTLNEAGGEGVSMWYFLWILFKTAAEAGLQVYGQIFIGIILSHPKIAFLNKVTIAFLSKILLFVLLPMLVLLKVGSAINFELLTQVLVAPVAGLCVTCFQFLLGQFLFMDWKQIFTLGKKKRSTKNGKIFPRNIIVLTVMFNNYVVIPYAFVMAFTETDLFLDPDKDAHAIAFVTLYYFPVMALFFSFGFWFTSVDPSRVIPLDEVVVQKEITVSKTKRIFGKVIAALRKFFPPAILALITGAIIGMIPPLKDFLFMNPPPIIAVFRKVLQLFAGAVLPVAFLVAGGNIGRLLWDIYIPKKAAEEEEKKEIEMDEKGEETKVKKKKGFMAILKKYWIIKHNSTYVCCASVLGKLVISPLCVFGVLAFFCLVFPEMIIGDKMLLPIMCMAIVIEASCPVTLIMSMLSSLYEVGEKEMSELLLLHHIVFPFTMVALCVLYLYFFCWVSSPYGCKNF